MLVIVVSYFDNILEKKYILKFLNIKYIYTEFQI
jgi:hypothetical protein